MQSFPKGKYRRTKRTKARASSPESILQKQAEDYLEILNLTYIRIPDTMNSIVFGTPSIPEHVKIQIASFTAGVADLTILHPEGHFLCVELKSDIGKQKQNQKDWARRIIGSYFIIRTFEDFRELVDNWLKQVAIQCANASSQEQRQSQSQDAPGPLQT